MDTNRQPQQQQNDKYNDIISNSNDNVDAFSATKQQLQVEGGTQLDDDDSYIRLQLRRFILIVEYDGTRYSGFQRQTSPSSSIASLASEYRKNCNGSNKKRKHSNVEDGDSHMNTIMTKRSLQRNCPLTIQECLEDSILDYCNNQLLANNAAAGGGGKNKKKRREKAKKKRRKQQEDEHANEEEQTSQQEEQQELPKMTRSDVEFKFSSRTDAGVHARGQVVAVNLPTITMFQQQEQQSEKKTTSLLLPNPYIMQSIQKSINSRLPKDISISYVSLCNDPNFNPRYGVQRKQYSYTIKYLRRLNGDGTSSSGKDKDTVAVISGPQLIRSALPNTNSNLTTTWICPWRIDDSLFDSYCQWLSGTHDYTVFCHKSVRRKQCKQEPGHKQEHETLRSDGADHDHDDKNSNVLTITKFTCERDDTSHILQQQNHQQHVKSISIMEGDDGISKSSDEPVVVVTATFRIEAKGFRRSMIRNLIGFIVDLGRGEIPCPFTTTTVNNNDDIKSSNSSPSSSSLRDRIWTGTEDVAKLVNQAPACGLCLEFVQY